MKKEDFAEVQAHRFDAADENTTESDETVSAVLELVDERPLVTSYIDGVVAGRILNVAPDGATRVTFPGAPPEGFLARSTTRIQETDIGHEVALMFEGGNPSFPIIMGKLVSPLASSHRAEATTDGRRVEFNAEEEIVLRCGESSITLTRAGKVIIRGTYVITRSSGVNRIQGSSVKIN